jgi:RIO kinase 1
MSNDLDSLLAEGVISEVVARLKSGKEADVFVVRYQGRDVAAKVYKDRSTRSFKNNAAYKEGRSVRSSRSQRAIDKGSKFGREAEEDAWKSAEVDAIYRLHGAGVRVPTPVLYFDGVLLMELVLDAEGAAARRVIDVPISVQEARDAYEDMLRQLVKILCCDLIHGDLSPYNVLWSANGPTVIDFPQIISASHNQSSEQFFLRDARNILGYFATIDRSLNARSGDPFEIWRTYRRRELTPDFVPRARPMSMQRPIPVQQAHAHAQGRAQGHPQAQPQTRQGHPEGDHRGRGEGDRRGPPRHDRGPRPDARQQGPQAQQGRPDFGPRGRGGPQDRSFGGQGRGPSQSQQGRPNNGQAPHGHGGNASHGGHASHGGNASHGGHASHGGNASHGNGQGRGSGGQGRPERPRGDDRQRGFGSKRPAPAPEVIVRRAPTSPTADREEPRQQPMEPRTEVEIAPAQPAPRRRRFPG